MVDPDPGYRPKRAFVEPRESADEASAPAEPTAAPPSPGPDPTSAPGKPGAAGPAPDAAPRGASALPPAGADAAPVPADDTPKPLFRDEVAPTAPCGAAAGDAPASGEETRIVRPLNFRQRQRRTLEDEDSTTLLARTEAGARPSRGDREEIDLDEERGHGLLGSRGRLALLVGALAAVVAVGIALIYAVSTVGDPTAQPSTSAPSSSTSTGPSGTPAADPSALLGETQLLSPEQAREIDRSRTWKVAVTQRPAAADAPLPACVGDEPAEGEPATQQRVVRVLSSTGKNAPNALHQASAYASPEEAAQAYAVASRTFGGCAAAGSYIASGAAVTGLGDQAAGLVVNVLTDGKTQLHSVVLSRTGSVLNVLDVAQPDKALALAGVAKALGAVTAAQCQPAGGACAAQAGVKDAPPPLGGDVPGFLASGDLPPAGEADESWVATPATPPSEDFLGSQCETVNWTRVGAEAASTRVYLVSSSTKFGLNDIVLTMKTEKAATDLAAKIKADLGSCNKRQLTATVSSPQEVEGPGTQGSTVTGWTSTVSQKTTDGIQRYRVGVVSSGTKVAYTFLNPLAGGYDLTQAEWDLVAVRAGQRMTQVP